MSAWTEILLVAGCIAGVAVFAGAETASYAVSRVRIDLEARQHSARSRLARWMTRDATTLLIVTLLGNALMVEGATWLSEDVGASYGLPRWLNGLVLALALTPLVFFFGDLLPKELARRRPHSFLIRSAPLLSTFRILCWPIERALRGFTWLVTRVLSVPEQDLSTNRGRESVLKLLSEGRISGALPLQAEALAQNVLKLRSIVVARAMIAWERVQKLERDAPNDELYRRVADSIHTRLPVVDAAGVVQGYVHQLDVLGEGPGHPVLEEMRELIALAPDLPVDRALARLRTSGQRLAVVGTLDAPLGLVTLKDLVEEISGDLAAW